MKTIATVGPVGYLPVAPGTAGAAVGLLMALILSYNPTHQAVGCLVAVLLGFWSSGPAAKAMNDNDPRQVVIDEVSGMMVGLLFLPVGWGIYLLAFLLFRFLDIFKPSLIRRVQDLPGSVGIMMDDLLAGLVTNLILRILLRLF